MTSPAIILLDYLFDDVICAPTCQDSHAKSPGEGTLLTNNVNSSCHTKKSSLGSIYSNILSYLSNGGIYCRMPDSFLTAHAAATRAYKEHIEQRASHLNYRCGTHLTMRERLEHLKSFTSNQEFVCENNDRDLSSFSTMFNSMYKELSEEEKIKLANEWGLVTGVLFKM